ncbi:MAG: phosphatase PAP2 family protein [Solirubrobacterales bacterium]
MRAWSFWEPLNRAELPALEWVEATRFGGGVERATLLITRAGEHGATWYAIFALGAIADSRHRGRWLGAAGAVTASYFGGLIVKLLLRRRRPALATLDTGSQLSFPSLHSVTSFAAARMLSQLAPRPFGALLSYLLAFAFAGSRLHFCVHYPSDLIAGAAIGDLAGRATVRRWSSADRT